MNLLEMVSDEIYKGNVSYSFSFFFSGVVGPPLDQVGLPLGSQPIEVIGWTGMMIH